MTHPRRWIMRLGSGCPLLGFALLGAVLPAAAQTVNDPGLQVEIAASGLVQPTSMAFIGDNDILVVQKGNGQVRRVLNGVLLAAPVLDVAVHSASERGLLGIATDPDFVNNRQVYIYYTESSTGADTSGPSTPLGNRVYRTRWDGSSLVGAALILDLPATPGPNHDGGVIAFGPDDALYAVIGDLNRGGRLQNIPTGPDPDDSGVILRVDRDGHALIDSPFFDTRDVANPMGRYYAYGVRNSFGFTFDPLTGALWDTENGPSSYDEVNLVVPGFNSGWVQVMGPADRDPEGATNLWVAPGSIYRDPEFSWFITTAPTAIIFPESPVTGCELQHQLLVGDNNCGQLYRFRPNASRTGLGFTSLPLQDKVADNGGGATCSGEQAEILFGSNFGVVTDLENGPDGRLYVVSLSAGRIYRIGPRPGAFPDIDRDGAGDGCDCAPSDATAFGQPVEVPRLRLSHPAATALGWDSQVATAGSGTVSTVVTGNLKSLSSDRGFASACTLADGLTTPALADPQADPPSGSGYYYLVRAGNVCGDGTYGDGSGSPDPRDPLDAGPTPPCACAARTGGALVSFSIQTERLAVWVTDGAFIDRAKQILSGGARQIPIFGTLLDGGACDPQWTWHADPADVSFADAAIELCDGLPSHVEANKDYWIKTVGSFCPWSAVVTAVDDRR